MIQEEEKAARRQKGEPCWIISNKDGGSLTLWRFRVGVTEHLVLVTKHVVVDVEFVCHGALKGTSVMNTTARTFTSEIWRFCRTTHLRRQHEGLHELPHRLHVVGQLAHHLHHHALVQGRMGIHVPDLGVTIAETQSHHPLMDLLQEEGEVWFSVCLWHAACLLLGLVSDGPVWYFVSHLLLTISACWS